MVVEKPIYPSDVWNFVVQQQQWSKHSNSKSTMTEKEKN